MERRENAGYVIVEALHIGKAEFVIGENPKAPAPYVTWECKDGSNYFWGHYLMTRESAEADLLERAGTELRRQQQSRKQKNKDVDTPEYAYLLRLNPMQGDYNLYIYCYRREMLEQHMEKAARGICFLDASGKERFRIPDGDSIRVTRPDGSHSDHTCRYIDENRAEIGYGVDNLYHMAQFAEWMARNGNTYVPLRSSLPKQCYSLLLDTGNVVILKRGETGYYKTDIPHTSKEEARALVEEYNRKLGVTRAQEEAMKGGSMFGFDKPIADPANYDAQGQPLKRREKDRGDAR